MHLEQGICCTQGGVIGIVRLKWFVLGLVQDDPEIPFTETDFRRRKAHPNFKEHIAAEKLVTKLGKTVSCMQMGHWVRSVGRRGNWVS